MRGQRTVFQSARDVKPSDAIGMQGEWSRAAEANDTEAGVQIVRRGRSQVFFVVGVVETSPFFFRFIPPHQLFALAPRSAVRTRRRAVINDAAVVGPGKSPAVAEQIFRIPVICAIAPFRGINATVNPSSAGSRA